MFAQSVASYGAGGRVEMRFDLLQQTLQTTCEKEVFHQRLTRRHDVGEHRNLLVVALPNVQRQLDAQPPSHRWQVHAGVGRSANREHRLYRVMKARFHAKVPRLQVFQHHGNDALADLRTHARMMRIHRWNRLRAGQRKAEHLGHRRHGGRGARRVAGAGAARHAALQLLPIIVTKTTRATLVPELHRVRSGSDLLPLK